MTVLEDGEVLTAIRLPAEWSGARFYFEKVADRNTWDFPLVNIAAAMKVSGAAGAETVDQDSHRGRARCSACRGGSRSSKRSCAARPKTADTASLAGQSAVRGATPLQLQPLQDSATAEPRHARHSRCVGATRNRGSARQAGLQWSCCESVATSTAAKCCKACRGISCGYSSASAAC